MIELASVKITMYHPVILKSTDLLVLHVISCAFFVGLEKLLKLFIMMKRKVLFTKLI
uniref:Uncharacterized protein n=1 Tax=Lepeophtheirus salmonis TaxID=72036 RepID=A0A0K2VB93_LEPSM